MLDKFMQTRLGSDSDCLIALLSVIKLEKQSRFDLSDVD